MRNNDNENNAISWLGISTTPNWNVARPLGSFLGAALTLTVSLLFICAIIAAFATLWHTFHLAASGENAGPNLGAGALITALLGAPFLIWSTVLKHQTVRYQKEGYITDRINKAIEQLGAERVVERIGRPVTIWTGDIDSFKCSAVESKEHENKPRTIVSDITFNKNIGILSPERNFRTVSTWREERTIIQWQGEQLQLAQSERVGREGNWQVFKETAPNIGVRIGALLSLERVAQDSTRYDSGRDHVRIMEIICAYIRENTTVAQLDPKFDEDEPPTPRTDIQVAIDVIKRRSTDQLKIEEIEKYRLDLRRCDFRNIDFSRGSLRGATLTQCRFDFANLQSTDFSGAKFNGSTLNFTRFYKSKLIGSRMDHCRFDKPRATPGIVNFGFLMGDITGLSLISANIPHINSKKIGEMTFGSLDTVLDGHLDQIRHETLRILENNDSDTLIFPKGGPFSNWSPYDGNDGLTHHLSAKFRKSLCLTGWPYED